MEFNRRTGSKNFRQGSCAVNPDYFLRVGKQAMQNPDWASIILYMTAV
jgi:hypothetical protein